MRRSHGAKIVTDDSGKLVAVSLGADACAEHEWGINSLREVFGCTADPTVVGLERRRTREMPSHLSWQTDGRKGGLQGMYCPRRPWRDDAPDAPNFRDFTDGKLCAAWDKSTFAVFSNDSEEIEALLTIFKALQDVDGVLWLGGGGMFQNAGLCIGIASRLPTEVVKLWEQKDNEAIALRKAMQATGIEDKLRAAGREYFALSPKFASDGSLIFWLNPCKQHIHQFGWMTLQDLEDWILGKGKCMKSGKR